MQEKLRKFRQFRPLDSDSREHLLEGVESGERQGIRAGFNARDWWRFSIESIVRSFRFKRGAIKAFKLGADLEKWAGQIFHLHMAKLYGPKMDNAKRE